MELSVRLSVGIALILIAASTVFLRELSRAPDGRLHVHVLDIGQGDSTLLVSPSGKHIVIDGGPDLSALEHLGRLLPVSDRRIELLVLTHPDLDHIASFPEIVRRYDIGGILLTGIQSDAPRYRALLEVMEERDVSVLLADPARDIVFEDGLILDIAWPPADTFGKTPKQPNDTSIVLRAFFGSASLLFTGDIEEEAERELLASGAPLEADILKVGHHGSRTSSSTGFLLAVRPELAIVSAGRDNSFGHPHPVVMERFQNLEISVRATNLEGTVSLVFP